MTIELGLWPKLMLKIAIIFPPGLECYDQMTLEQGNVKQRGDRSTLALTDGRVASCEHIFPAPWNCGVKWQGHSIESVSIVSDNRHDRGQWFACTFFCRLMHLSADATGLKGVVALHYRPRADPEADDPLLVTDYLSRAPSPSLRARLSLDESRIAIVRFGHNADEAILASANSWNIDLLLSDFLTRRHSHAVFEHCPRLASGRRRAHVRVTVKLSTLPSAFC